MDMQPKIVLELNPLRPVITSSFSDQLFSSHQDNSDIPYNINRDPLFLESLQKRKALIESYNVVFSVKGDLATHYRLLTQGLTEDKDLTRLVLYYPFELLPQANTEKEEERGFLKTYKEAIFTLSTQEDNRANFYDGDIPEPSLRHTPLPKVIKVIHLFPILIQKGILTDNDIIEILRLQENRTVMESFADIIPVLQDKGILSETIKEEIISSGNRILLASLARANEQREVKHDSLTTPESLFKDFASEYVLRKKMFKHDDVYERRNSWKDKAIQKELVYKYSRLLYDWVIATKAHISEVKKYYEQGNDDMKVIVLHTLILLLENGSHIPQPGELLHFVNETKTDNDPRNIKKARQLFFNHASRKGYSTTQQVIPQCISTSETEIAREYKSLMKKITGAIEKSPELVTLIYPCLLSVGSNAKGYATEESDKDFAIFVRPTTQESDRQKIQSLLQKIRDEVGTDISFMEFWLEEAGDNTIAIKDYTKLDPERGDSTLTHPFTGFWSSEGTNEEVKQLRKKVARYYLTHQKSNKDSLSYRKVWLKDLEHTTLQYRLMHSGFGSFYRTENKDLSKYFSIDGDSAFYDDAYRKVATSLFLKKVFLPQIS